MIIPTTLQMMPPGQLFDMETGYEERENLYAQHPEIVSQLTDLLNQYKKTRRSVPLQ